MYESFYKLHPTPFRLTPDPRFYFNSATHERGFAFLRYAFLQREGFVVITGAPGTGKTELMLNLIQHLPRSQTTLAKIVTSSLDADDLLDLVAASFLLTPQTGSKGTLLKNLEDFFIEQAHLGKQVLLLIDEAHNLSDSALIELSMLSNFQIEEKPVLQCFLMGQPSLEAKLEQPELAHLKQRVVVSTHLEPFFERETQAYIEHRLTKAGWTGNPEFSDRAFSLIHQYSEGIARRINALCSRVLLEAYLEETGIIDAALVGKIIEEIQEETVAAQINTAQIKLDLDFAQMGKTLISQNASNRTAETVEQPVLSPEMQFPQKSAATNNIDVALLSKSDAPRSSTFTLPDPDESADDEINWETAEEDHTEELISISDVVAVSENTNVKSNSNVRAFPGIKSLQNSGGHNTQQSVRQPATSQQSPKAPGDSSRPPMHHGTKSGSSDKLNLTASARQSGLLDKELRALASWYNPPAQSGVNSKTNKSAATKSEPKKTLIDDLVQQDDFSPQQDNNNSDTALDDSQLNKQLDWLPISKFGITISVASLSLLWWFTYGPGVGYTISMFESLNTFVAGIVDAK